MKKIILTFGLISGGILATMMGIAIPMCVAGRMDFDKGEIVGYSSMILAFLLVFFGIRSYRENIGGGSVTFGRAFKVGILITLIASIFYVVAWQILYHNFVPNFEDVYATHVINKLRAEGASSLEIAATQKKMDDFKRLYKNPLFNIGMTFLEVFPLGLVVSLVSAAILRKKPARLEPALA